MTSNNSIQGKYYIGLMSGTSADGIDLALVNISNKHTKPELVASFYQAYNTALAEKITALYVPGTNEVDSAFHLDIELAHLFAKAVTSLLIQENLEANDIAAIGNHGQTIRHRPTGEHPYTLQIGCCQTLATLTGIRVVGQFRRKDMALGGQGAPLVPVFHQQLFAEQSQGCFVVNIGGIANITYLPEQGSSNAVLGFDTGPGNALLDEWFTVNHPANEHKYDKSGAWAATGQVNQGLLNQFMQDDYIIAQAPKSTGREYFNFDWLTHQLDKFTQGSTPILPKDVQATLLAYTAHSIYQSILALAKRGKVYVCGGGVHNDTLLENLMSLGAERFEINTMQAVNLDGDQLEAMAFAWFAYAFDNKIVSNMPSVTGAKATCTLGSEFLP